MRPASHIPDDAMMIAGSRSVFSFIESSTLLM